MEKGPIENAGKPSKTRKHRSRGKVFAAGECNSFECNSDGSGSDLQFFKFPTKKRVGAI